MAKGKKFGGRRKGTPNKKTTWLKEYLEDVDFNWNEEFSKLWKEDLSDISNQQKMDVLLGMLPYLSAKVKDQEPPKEEPGTPSEEETSSTEDLLSLVIKN